MKYIPTYFLSILVLIVISKSWCSAKGIIKGKALVEHSNESEESEESDDSNTPSPWTDQKEVVDQYNYTFDFELAVTSGLTPTPDWSPNSILSPYKWSSPGCPKPYKDNPWVLYGNPPKCYLTGYQWPCPENMMLRHQLRSAYGYCDCHCNEYNSISSRYCTKRSIDSMERVFTYSKELNACLPFFEKGKCKEGEWLVMGVNPLNGPICEKRRCPVSSEDEDGIIDRRLSFFDYRTESCHKVGDDCTHHLFGKSGTSYLLSAEDWAPVCDIKPEQHHGGASVANSLQGLNCPSRQTYSNVLKMCIPLAISFNEEVR